MYFKKLIKHIYNGVCSSTTFHFNFSIRYYLKAKSTGNYLMSSLKAFELIFISCSSKRVLQTIQIAIML